MAHGKSVKVCSYQNLWLILHYSRRHFVPSRLNPSIYCRFQSIQILCCLFSLNFGSVFFQVSSQNYFEHVVKRESRVLLWEMTELAATARTISSSIDATTLVCIVQVGHCAISNVVVGLQLVGAPGQIRGCQDRCGGLTSNPPAFPPTAAAGQGPKWEASCWIFPQFLSVNQPNTETDSSPPIE